MTNYARERYALKSVFPEVYHTSDQKSCLWSELNREVCGDIILGGDIFWVENNNLTDKALNELIRFMGDTYGAKYLYNLSH